jgi:polyisoprenoid-binding protein YceI
MKMKCFRLWVAPILLLSHPALAADWTVDAAKSRVGFSGVQNGEAFKGDFGKWTAEIGFVPDHPEAGHAKVSINLASARTGDAQRDAALPQLEWFDVKTSPSASFEAKSFVAKGGDAYEAPGKLTIRGVSKDVVLPFTVTIQDGKAAAKGHLTLARMDFGVGQGSWSTGEWVALEVGVDVDITAAARP